MATVPLVGFLVPLNNNLEEENGSSIPKIPVSTGVNYVGRQCIPTVDKRLSRRHLTINSLDDGSADVFVEGTNPVVWRSKNERKKLLSGEKWKILPGDVIELIPGNYVFRYVSAINKEVETSPNTNREKRPLNDGSSDSKDHAFSSKKMQKAARNHNVLGPQDSSEDTLCFQNSKDKLPLAFKLLRVKELQEWANVNTVSISDVVRGDVLVAILSNYMVDIDWLLSGDGFSDYFAMRSCLGGSDKTNYVDFAKSYATLSARITCPTIKRVPHVLVIHGEGDGTLEYMKRNKPSNWILHKPPLPISYGTHHSKAMFLVYPRGIRVIVHTANLIYVDWNNKSQALWMQDFPWKDPSSASSGCGFESDLIDYLSALKWPEFNANLPAIGSFSINASFFKKFNYSSAPVRLISSVPGYHSGSSIRKWGHMKLRTILQECIFEKEFEKSPLVYQFSSLGSLDEKWMAELASSMSSGMTEDQKPLGLGKPLIIWPTVEDVRCSLEVMPGYAAGNAVPSPLKNVEKEFLKKYWAKWKASHTGRCRAMPHIKTFTRYNGQNLAWFLLTSANLSKAAWGALQKNNSQLMIRSYELGVLFLPFAGKSKCGFSCTDDECNSEGKGASAGSSEVQKAKLVTLAWKGNFKEERNDVIQLPVPYELPPRPYSSQDVPWSWDRRYTEKDVYGQVWPRQVKLYTSQDF